MIEPDKREFKQSWRDEYLEHICGMANADGGSLFIGLDDNGSPVGIEEKDLRKLLEDIPNKIVDGLHLYNVKVRPLSSEEGKFYIEIVVPKCNETQPQREVIHPYRYADQGHGLCFLPRSIDGKRKSHLGLIYCR